MGVRTASFPPDLTLEDKAILQNEAIILLKRKEDSGFASPFSVFMKGLQSLLPIDFIDLTNKSRLRNDPTPPK